MLQRARLGQHEVVNERLACRDGRLREPTYAIHSRGHRHPVPMDTRGFRNLVRDENANAITSDRLDGRARAGSVVTPKVRGQSGSEFANDGLCEDVELLDAFFHSPGKGPPVERDDWAVRTPRDGSRWRLHRCRSLRGGLGQGRCPNASHGRCTKCGGASSSKKVSAVVHRESFSARRCPRLCRGWVAPLRCWRESDLSWRSAGWSRQSSSRGGLPRTGQAHDLVAS